MISALFQLIINKVFRRGFAENPKKDYEDTPKDLYDAIQELKKDNEDNEQIQEMIKMSEDSFVSNFHFTIGMNIRNTWGLWNTNHPSDLALWFNSRGIYHPDDMSGIILKSFYRSLKGEPIRLNEQIKNYRDFWISRDLDPDKPLDKKST